MMLNKVKDHADLLKDKKSGAVLLADHIKANEYALKKKTLKNDADMAKEINNIKERLSGLEQIQTDMSDIKLLLQQMTNTNNGNK